MRACGPHTDGAGNTQKEPKREKRRDESTAERKRGNHTHNTQLFALPAPPGPAQSQLQTEKPLTRPGCCSAEAMPAWCEVSPASPGSNGCCWRQLDGPAGACSALSAPTRRHRCACQEERQPRRAAQRRGKAGEDKGLPRPRARRRRSGTRNQPHILGGSLSVRSNRSSQRARGFLQHRAGARSHLEAAIVCFGLGSGSSLCCTVLLPPLALVPGCVGNGAPHERRGVSAIRILESSRQLATGQDPPGDPHANGGMSGGARCLAVQIQEEMLITAHGQDIVSRYSYWKFKSRNPSDYVQCAHPHTFR